MLTVNVIDNCNVTATCLNMNNNVVYILASGRQRQVDRKAGELKSSDKKPIVKQNGISSASDQSDQPAVNLTNGDTDSLKAPAGSSGGSFQSQQSSPSSQEESDVSSIIILICMLHCLKFLVVVLK